MRNLFLLLAAALMTTACSGKYLRVAYGHKNPEFEPARLTSVVVVGISDKPENRVYFEKKMARGLKRWGADAVPSSDIVSTDIELTKETFDAARGERSFEAYLITRVVSVSVDNEWVAAKTQKVQGMNPQYYERPGAPAMYGGNFYPSGSMDPYFYGTVWSYVPTTYQIVTADGYDKETRKVVLETNLYDAATEELVWSAQTVAVDMTDRKKAVSKMRKGVIRELQRVGLLKPTEEWGVKHD